MIKSVDGAANFSYLVNTSALGDWTGIANGSLRPMTAYTPDSNYLAFVQQQISSGTGNWQTRVATSDDAGTTITPDLLRGLGFINKRGRVKVLGEGELTKKLEIHAHAFSLGAVEKIRAAGGEVTVVE